MPVRLGLGPFAALILFLCFPRSIAASPCPVRPNTGRITIRVYQGVPSQPASSISLGTFTPGSPSSITLWSPRPLMDVEYKPEGLDITASGHGCRRCAGNAVWRNRRPGAMGQVAVLKIDCTCSHTPKIWRGKKQCNQTGLPVWGTLKTHRPEWRGTETERRDGVRKNLKNRFGGEISKCWRWTLGNHSGAIEALLDREGGEPEDLIMSIISKAFAFVLAGGHIPGGSFRRG
ncbi:hypothetical protein DFH06DRAFT_1128688 [Mycena polygramma]|nr:hypothetical protein DFH06DRAFT_1128688 [Mycena polygramma]